MHVSQKRLCILSIEKMGPEPTYLSTSTTSKQSKVQIQLWPSSPTSNTCRLLNQISKVNTKSTNLNGTYRKRSVFHHLLNSTARTTTFHSTNNQGKIRHISFFSSETKKSKKKFFFTQRLISVKIGFRKKKLFMRNFFFYFLARKLIIFFRKQISFLVSLKDNLFNFFY